MATVPESLVRLCKQQGVDLHSLPEGELLPAIIGAVSAQHQQTKLLLAKSALIVQQVCSYCPNEGIERDEGTPLQESPADPNESLTSLFPW